MFRKSVAAASVLGSAALAVAALSSGGAALAAPSSTPNTSVQATSKVSHSKVTTFSMARAAGVVKAGCLPYAKARVSIQTVGENETMRVSAWGLPKSTAFDFFVLQVPDAPFGLAWYQGDLSTNKYGQAHATYRGRFNEETFSVAVGTAPAPVKHSTPPRNDAKVNPVTAPVHQYHLGFWFNSPKDAAKAGCGDVVTPFNGEHNAGTQAMSTRNFAPEAGPLSKITS